VKIALAQINPTVGDLAGNSRRIVETARKAATLGADLVVFPELCVCGYPPQDLLDRPSFIASAQLAVRWIAREAPAGVGLIVGAPVPNPAVKGKRLFNAALLLEDGRLVAEVHKALLPTYDVFDEYRYFEPAESCSLVEWRGLKIGLHICEDMWNNEELAPYYLYRINPIDDLARNGADLFVNLSASPYYPGRHEIRSRLIAESCREHSLPFVYVNQVGANTELIFDGDSRVHDAQGRLVHVCASFSEDLFVWDTDAELPPTVRRRERIADLHDALVLGIRDYVSKTGTFSKALLGLSGGIDSAVTAALAVAALGRDRVVGITMPSKYSSAGSVDDSAALAKRLGIEFHHIPIGPAVGAFEGMLAPLFAGTTPGIAEENIQARTRGLTLMAVSNKFNYLLLSTGNKSEMSVGYATLYGDMNGGLAVLADVFKQDVYALAEYVNVQAGRDLIPRNTIEKPPSAELRPGQKDSDSLPPYPVLDEVLRRYVEEIEDLDTIVRETGLDRAFVHRILQMVDRNEYKRRQAAPGLRVSKKAFGVGRRLPIVMRWDWGTRFEHGL
jgi:NAD+ synthase (glutamine-hydrolysing)